MSAPQTRSPRPAPVVGVGVALTLSTAFVLVASWFSAEGDSDDRTLPVLGALAVLVLAQAWLLGVVPTTIGWLLTVVAGWLLMQAGWFGEGFDHLVPLVIALYGAVGAVLCAAVVLGVGLVRNARST